ncbi:DUF3488 and transglutaminase-like domain-containing protein [Blastococcus sp. LR1]|uniref:DUF3488 and transglutaminase-like domain-containing protein n=1 Tax=Blastococcus sp. LR1 TaxID=2877000 RepID=UPI001CCCA20A|nr:DUF3488 and transglutaminase-like domain-containing protein [Blastococcus sp. LR1]MCA0143586.1 DUF3488 and transglutaminase-like domain-containing protein [Blastococcus sp. LR1]
MIRADLRSACAAAVATLLGTIALTPVFTSSDWFPPAFVVVGAVLAGGLLIRMAGDRAAGGREPSGSWALLVPVGQLVLVACGLTALFAPDGAVAGLVPTPESLRGLGGVLADGVAEVREQATPALPLNGLLALTTLFVGLVAVAVDLVAVTARRPAVAGLALLVLFCVPVGTVTGAIGLPALLAPAAGFAVLLWADQQRALAGSHGRAGGSGAAMRIAAVALVAGVVLGPLVPTVTEGSFGTGLGGGAGGATGTSLDPVAELRGELSRPEPIDLLRVDASVEDLGYLRAVALDVYDPEQGWTLSNLDGEVSVADDDLLAPLPSRQPGRPVNASIRVLEHDDRFLPVPTSPLAVDVGEDGGAWRFDGPTGTVFGRDTSSAGLEYRVRAVEPRPSADLLGRAVTLPPGSPLQERFGVLPELDPSVGALTAELTADAATPYERVLRIQEYLTDRRNGFTYSLSTSPGTSGDDLVDFLRLKRGYCEQYAGAMAVLVRQAGLPSRVALGYTPGSVQDDRSRLVTSDDAHAWVEVFFQGYGWVAFDPTPIALDRRVPLPWSPRVTDEREEVEAAPAPSAPTEAPPVEVPREDRAPAPAPQAQTPQGSSTSLRPVLVAVGAGAAVGALLALPGGLRVLRRRRRLAGGSPAGLWDELRASATDLGIRLDPAWTPRQVAAELTTAARPAPGLAEAFADLARAEEAATYGRPGAGSLDARLPAALRTARAGLDAAAPWHRRVGARLWPASVLGELRAALPRRPGTTPAAVR